VFSVQFVLSSDEDTSCADPCHIHQPHKMDTQNWCTIESDPGVFTELMETMGAKDVMAEEFFDLSDEAFEAIAPAYGLLFLFRWTEQAGAQSSGEPIPPDRCDPQLFFAKQTITNACATQAILSILLNSTSRANVGSLLQDFKEFTQDFSPEMKGETLGSNPMIRTAHNAFARPEPFVMEDSGSQPQRRRKGPMDEDDDDGAYHFVAYVPFKGGLYELDGLKRGPVLLMADAGFGEDVDSSAWLKAARPFIQARMEQAAGKITFNLMAIIRDRRVGLREKIKRAEDQGNTAAVQTLQLQLADEEEKRKIWTEENIRRKHNYVPFIVGALKLLAKRKKLKNLVRAAQEKAAERKRNRGGS
jgi:ubiquitin carboxyl-terminal hydrolase L5